MKFYTTSKISENIHETPEGFLVCIGVPIARTGEMVYGEGETPLETDDDGKILIDREEAEVFRPETIASFEGKAVTITHPTEFVSPENWSRLAKGVLQNVRRGEGEQENDLVADLLITDSVAINLVKNGLREVSCGYEAEYTQTGEGRGLQTNIVGNHLALVDQGRAGSSYAINDHKGKVSMKKTLLEKLTKRFGAKVIDEVMAEDEKPAKDAKDAKDAKEGGSDKDEKESKDAGAYDELKKMVSDLGEKIAAMGKPKDETSPAENDEPAKTDAKDDGAESSLEDRLKALETAVAKLLESQSKDSGEESEESEDEDGEEEESEDDDFEESTMTGDTASRVEILAPGLKAAAKDAKAKALKAAYATKDGKAVIDQFTGGKAPELKDAARVNTLFIAASEILKSQRTSELASTKQTRDSGSAGESAKGAMSAEQMNAINAKHYGNK